MVDWYVEGVEFGNCSCNYGCPCQFEDLPTGGSCRGMGVLRIDKGHFGEVRLDGLKSAVIYAWPGPVFEGNGTMQAVIDERADAAQREALATILRGGETDEAATHWWVYHAMSSTVHPPLFKPIHFEVDVGGRTARVDIPGVMESVGEPIRSRVDGKPHRVRIDLPNGIEFGQTEVGSGSTKIHGALQMELAGSYAQFHPVRHTGRGRVR
jgi:hypothetical protein